MRRTTPWYWRENRAWWYAAKITCFLCGHKWEWSKHGIDENGYFTDARYAVEFTDVHGDCHRCGA